VAMLPLEVTEGLLFIGDEFKPAPRCLSAFFQVCPGDKVSGQVGRRPGRSVTRADVVKAAAACFAEDGYERASLRSIARRAGVDPALVHHFFRGKSELFMATMSFRRDPSDIFDEVQSSTRKGEVLLRAFLRDWEPDPAGGPSPFVSLVQAICSSPDTARALREFLTERVWARPRDDGHPSGPRLRQSLITSQLWGVAMARYVLGLEPLASATLDDVASWYGPVLQATFDLE
jgi:AcrR family transcriptional regulator